MLALLTGFPHRLAGLPEGATVKPHPAPFRGAVAGFLALALAAPAIGCAKTDVDVTRRTVGALPKPDRVVVRNFAVTRREVELDAGIAPSMIRAVSGEVESSDAIHVGHAAADALADELVKQLNEKKILAVRGDRTTPVTSITAILVGQFRTLDEGNQTLRTLVGFGLGGSEVRAHAQVVQGGVLIASADTTANSGTKPGAAVTLGVGAAAGTAATAAAVTAGTTTVSELFMTSVNAGARRTARENADTIEEAYEERGWLAD
jgi:hypothetical protein